MHYITYAFRQASLNTLETSDLKLDKNSFKSLSSPKWSGVYVVIAIRFRDSGKRKPDRTSDFH
jgi:hypothetical protein